MLYIIIAAGLTIFFATTLLIIIFERRSTAEARLLDAVQGVKPVVTTSPFRPAAILTEISSATERVRRAIGITNTSNAARQLALAGYRLPLHVEIFYAVRLTTSGAHRSPHQSVHSRGRDLLVHRRHDLRLLRT